MKDLLRGLSLPATPRTGRPTPMTSRQQTRSPVTIPELSWVDAVIAQVRVVTNDARAHRSSSASESSRTSPSSAIFIRLQAALRAAAPLYEGVGNAVGIDDDDDDNHSINNYSQMRDSTQAPPPPPQQQQHVPPPPVLLPYSFHSARTTFTQSPDAWSARLASAEEAVLSASRAAAIHIAGAEKELRRAAAQAAIRVADADAALCSGESITNEARVAATEHAARVAEATACVYLAAADATVRLGAVEASVAAARAIATNSMLENQTAIAEAENLHRLDQAHKRGLELVAAAEAEASDRVAAAVAEARKRAAEVHLEAERQAAEVDAAVKLRMAESENVHLREVAAAADTVKAAALLQAADDRAAIALARAEAVRELQEAQNETATARAEAVRALQEAQDESARSREAAAQSRSETARYERETALTKQAVELEESMRAVTLANYQAEAKADAISNAATKFEAAAAALAEAKASEVIRLKTEAADIESAEARRTLAEANALELIRLKAEAADIEAAEARQVLTENKRKAAIALAESHERSEAAFSLAASLAAATASANTIAEANAVADMKAKSDSAALEAVEALEVLNEAKVKTAKAMEEAQVMTNAASVLAQEKSKAEAEAASSSTYDTASLNNSSFSIHPLDFSSAVFMVPSSSSALPLDFSNDDSDLDPDDDLPSPLSQLLPLPPSLPNSRRPDGPKPPPPFSQQPSTSSSSPTPTPPPTQLSQPPPPLSPPPQQSQPQSDTNNTIPFDPTRNVVLGLLRGTIFNKHGRQGQPHPRLLWLDVTQNELGLRWGKPSNGIDHHEASHWLSLGDVLSVVRGRNTPVLKRSAKASAENRCWSLIAGTRTLDFESPNQDVAEMWANGLFRLFGEPNLLQTLLMDIVNSGEWAPPT
jgi:hypothetical protein